MRSAAVVALTAAATVLKHVEYVFHITWGDQIDYVNRNEDIRRSMHPMCTACCFWATNIFPIPLRLVRNLAAL